MSAKKAHRSPNLGRWIMNGGALLVVAALVGLLVPGVVQGRAESILVVCVLLPLLAALVLYFRVTMRRWEEGPGYRSTRKLRR